MAPVQTSSATTVPSPRTATPEAILRGTPVVPGLAFGPVVRVVPDVPEEAVRSFVERFKGSAEEALGTYDEAVGSVATMLSERASSASGAAAEVLVATAGLVRDKGLRSAVSKRLKGGEDLIGSVHGAVDQFADLFAKMGGLMAERVTDLRDIEKRLVAHVVGAPEPGLAMPSEPSILVAEDLAPADTAGLDPSLVVALVTERGGPTSHTAIIARQLGIPCVVGVAGATGLEEGRVVLVDGGAGTVETSPDPQASAARVEADRTWRATLASWAGPAVTRDGARVKVLANVADGASARKAAEAPVEGVGLFRTELCFLDTTVEPTVEEQAAVYGEVLAAFGPDQHVVIRTLDAGSDKPIAYATPAGEENPALGIRGLRLSFGDPSMLERQIEAIARAAAHTGTEPWVMAPMVATVAEATVFAEQVRRHGLKVGVMVEVPSAALLADRLLEVVDFLSIGTNDLTQYAMAADRMATDLAHLTDPWQPAVLQLVALTAKAGKEAGKPVGVCGEAAADPALASVLVGMGITSLSMAPAAVRAVGAQLGQVTAQQCTLAAEVALGATDPAEARAAVREVLSLQ
jgi:phosphotransferase system enzyme I (PtsI)